MTLLPDVPRHPRPGTQPYRRGIRAGDIVRTPEGPALVIATYVDAAWVLPESRKSFVRVEYADIGPGAGDN